MVLETFFENDADMAVSVQPLIERFAEHTGLRLDLQSRDEDKFREYTISQMLKDIVDMDARMREKIFNQKVLNSLTILLETMQKEKLETVDDVVWYSADDANIKKFRALLEKKGYIKKFNDAVMRDILGKDVEMRRKRTDDQVGEIAPVKAAIPEIIQTKSRKVQLFPAIAGAWVSGVVAISGFISASVFAIFSMAAFTQHDPLASLQCYQYTAQAEQQSAAGAMAGASSGIPQTISDICSSVSDASAFAVVFIILAIASLAVAIFFTVGFLKVVLHNQFAKTHNAFELTHYTMTNK